MGNCTIASAPQDVMLGSQLRRAVIIGDIDEVERLCRLIRRGPTDLVNEPEPESSTAEHAFFFDIKGQTALHLAASYGRESIMRILLDRGASISLDHYGRQPAHLAAEKGHFDCLKLLLSLNHSDKKSRADRDKAKVLLDPNVRERVCGKTLLHLSSAFGHTDQIRFLLSMEGIKINKQEMTGSTALHYACAEGHHECVKLLLAHADADLTTKEYIYGQTALHKASIGGHYKCIELILAHTAGAVEVNVADEEFGRTALHWAAQASESLECLELLLKKAPVRCDVLKEDMFGRAALVYASMFGNTAGVRLLLDAGAEANRQDREGMTALLHAAQNCKHETLVLLLDHPQVDKNIENLDGESVWTIRHRDEETQRIVKSYRKW